MKEEILEMVEKLNNLAAELRDLTLSLKYPIDDSDFEPLRSTIQLVSLKLQAINWEFMDKQWKSKAKKPKED